METGENSWPTIDILSAVSLGLIGILVSVVCMPWPQSGCAAALALSMSAVTISDVRRFIIPDWLSLPAIPAGLLTSGFLIDTSSQFLVAPQSILGMIIGAGALLAVRHGYTWLRDREGLGLGDIKLAAVAGAWTGAEGFAHVLLLASVTALTVVFAATVWLKITGRSSYVTAQTAVPYGAFLAPSIWLIYVLQNSSA